MSDAGAGWQDPGVRGLLAGVPRMPSAAREHALAVVGAQHAPELEHDARRLVRTLGVADADRPAALEVVGAVQRGVLHDAVSGRRVVDGRSWAPTVRFEAARAVRHEAARGRLGVTPYQHRLAADRAALLAVRQVAAAAERAAAERAAAERAAAERAAAAQSEARAARTVRATAAEQLRPVASTGRRVALPGMVFPPVPQIPSPKPAPVAAPPRTGRSSGTTRSVRFGAAAALSSVTLIFGAAIAPADDSGTGGTPGEFELDRLQLHPFGWKPFDLDGVEPAEGTDEAVTEAPQVVPAPEPPPVETPSPEPEQPEPAPSTPAPQPAPEPAPAPAPAPAPPATTPAPQQPAQPGAPGSTPGRGQGDQHWDSGDDDWQRLRESWDRARRDWEQARDDWRNARDDYWSGGWSGWDR